MVTGYLPRHSYHIYSWLVLRHTRNVTFCIVCITADTTYQICYLFSLFVMLFRPVIQYDFIRICPRSICFLAMQSSAGLEPVLTPVQ
jgi:hypothetical protein